jgi:dephospho-CoA kinase
MKIGLTGGIASGKSTVSDMLVKYGARLIDADQVAREIVAPHHAVWHQIVEHFGADIVLPSGQLDRKKLGTLIFQNPKARQYLNDLMHPPIRALIRSRIEAYAHTDPEQLIVVAIPLLYESGLEPDYDEVMVVYVPPIQQMERLMARDQLTLDQAEQRIQAQMPIDLKKERADSVIDNQGSLADTEKQVVDWLTRKGFI